FAGPKIHDETMEILWMLAHYRTRRNRLGLPVGICRCKQQRGVLLPITRRLVTTIFTCDINAPQVPTQVTCDDILRSKLPLRVYDCWGRQAIRRAGVCSCEIDSSRIDPEIVDPLNPLAIRSWSLQTVEEYDEKHGMPCCAIVPIPKHRSPSSIR